MKSNQVPDLNSLRILAEVARTESFSAAAVRLKLPASTVSRRLQDLEDALGVALLLRSTRRVSLTEGGAKLLDDIGEDLARIDRSIETLRDADGAPGGVLRIATSFSFAHSILPPILTRYAQCCPEVSVDIQTTHKNVDLIGEGVDVALRMGEPADSDMKFRRVGALKLGLFAAPSFLAAHPVTSPDDLRSARLVSHRMRMRRDRTFWELTNQDQRVAIDCPPAIIVDDPVLVSRLICEGVGIGLMSDVLAAENVAMGKLVRLLPDWSGPSVSLYYLYHQRLGDLPKVRLFLDAVREVLREKAAD